MTRVVAIAVVVAAAVAVVTLAVAHGASDGAAYYGSNLRGPLFSGFLSLGGFLLSLKTFILVKMKEGVYDNARYRMRVRQARKAHPKRNIKIFGELEQLRILLFLAIVAALVTAVSQMTLGLVKQEVVVAICLALAGFTLALLVQALLQINANLGRWFEYLEKEAEEEESAELAKLTDAALRSSPSIDGE